MFNTAEDRQKLGKSQIEAATASAAAMSRGLQQIAAESSAHARSSVEHGSAAATRLMATKSLDAAVQVQADDAKSALQGLMAQAGRMGALVMEVGKDVAEAFAGATPFDLAGRR